MAKTMPPPNAEPITGSIDGSNVAPTIVIERMRRRDLRQVLRIEERTSSTPWSLGLFLAEVRRAERCYLVARDVSGRAPADVPGDVSRSGSAPAVVGYAGMLFVLDEGHVTTVAVDPDRQGARIGTRLMVAMLRDAIVRGARNLTLEVRASNDAALALYRRFGFAPAGVRANYYADPVEDALVLWVHDIDAPEYAARLDAISASLGIAPELLAITGVDDLDDTSDLDASDVDENDVEPSDAAEPSGASGDSATDRRGYL